MKKERRCRRQFDDQFRLSVLKDYYESGCSYSEIARKYDINSGNIIHWERKYMNKCVPLSSDIHELEQQVIMAKKTRKTNAAVCPQPLSEEERLKAENARLRKALAYSELRNEALHEVLKIGKEQYGIDLLKKLAPSSRQPSAQAFRYEYRLPERTVWQDPRRLLLCEQGEACPP